ncbi:MAG: SsrA-binding protein SmpB [Deltaproteobacteria bacterium]|nr:SsrA-binding protein SmpB [Deltaproteobacteria bacterium]
MKRLLALAALAPALVGCVVPSGARAPAAAPLPIVAEVEANGRVVPLAEFVRMGARADVVCLGEQHGTSTHHRLHGRLVETWGQAARAEGRALALGLEMFERTAQPALDAYHRGALDHRGLLAATDWTHRWGHDPEPYRPLLEGARGAVDALLALNARREVTRAVAKMGLDALPPAVRAEVPELVLDDAEHQRFFAAAMGAHAHGGGAEALYTAQVIWDETMAATAAAWLLVPSNAPRQVVVVAGNGHCHRSAIPRRIARRLEAAGRRHGPIVSVLTRSGRGGLPSLAASDYVLTVPEERMAKHKKNDAPAVEQYGDGIIAKNRRASFDYELSDTYEAGLQLIGSEVKVLRAGKADLSDAYVTIERGEAFVHGANIPELSGTPFGHEPKRKRKLLLNRDEIDAIERATEREGMTVVATKIYFRGGRAKLEIALARGKKLHDKRESLKRKEADREARAAVSGRRG